MTFSFSFKALSAYYVQSTYEKYKNEYSTASILKKLLQTLWDYE